MCEDGPNSADILAWYDENARDLPWRIPPQASRAGRRPDPYHIWLSEVMLQQTTVAAVARYFRHFRATWPDVHALADAPDKDVMAAWAGLGYYARARNLLKCARVVSRELGGVFPQDMAGLQALPGIGPYTAGAIAAIAFDRPETVVDANVERVMARVFAVKTPIPAGKPVLHTYAARMTPRERAGDYAQAVMDLGATVCGRKPDCSACPWAQDCRGFALGIAAELPRKTPKKAKPERQGIVYLARRVDGKVLVETRPAKGLLGGMPGFPGTVWQEGPVADSPPLAANWRVLPQTVRHTFTHFHLTLQVQVARVDIGVNPGVGRFEDPAPQDMPTVMRKVWALGG